MKKFIVVLVVIVILALAIVYGIKIYNENKSKVNIGIEQKITDAARGENKPNIVLYDGIEMKTEPGTQILSDMTISDEANQRYNTTYYNFEHSKYTGTTEGEFGEETYIDCSVVTNVGRIAMTQKYDAIPREYKEIEEPRINLNIDYTDIDINEIDLDGDGSNEYIVCYKIDKDEEAYSNIMILNSKWEKVTDLVTLPDGFWSGTKKEENKVFLSLDDVDYIDIDRDGIMEILIKVPMYEGTKVSVVKYNQGEIEGDIELQASVNP